jgi:sulfoxide reductase catalytic subunit YedY
MQPRPILCVILLASLAMGASAQDRVKVTTSTPYGEIMMMDPKRVDPSALPLTPVESMHSTGTYQSVELATWRLTVSGRNVANPLSLTYEELQQLPMEKKRAILICPGFFYDYLEWEGVPLGVLLEKAGAGEYAKVVFTSVDGYKESFKRNEVQSRFIVVALKGNGVPLPRAQGFPARVVAEDIYGTRWVKYLTAITLE